LAIGGAALKNSFVWRKSLAPALKYNISTEYMELIHTYNVDAAKIYTWNATAFVVNRF